MESEGRALVRDGTLVQCNAGIEASCVHWSCWGASVLKDNFSNILQPASPCSPHSHGFDQRVVIETASHRRGQCPDAQREMPGPLMWDNTLRAASSSTYIKADTCQEDALRGLVLSRQKLLKGTNKTHAKQPWLTLGDMERVMVRPASYWNINYEIS